MVMGAAVFGAALASVVMVNWLMPRLGKNESARQMPVSNAPANEPAPLVQNPPANSPEQPPPVKLPPVPARDADPQVPPKEEYPAPPPTEEPQSVASVQIQPEASFRVRAKGAQWQEGSAQSVFTWGDRLQVKTGSMLLTCGKVTLVCFAGADLELTQNAQGISADLALTLREGRFAISRDAASQSALVTPVASLTFTRARFVVVVRPESSELRILEGSVAARSSGLAQDFGAGLRAMLTTRFEHRLLTSEELQALEAEFQPAGKTSLRWDFEGGQNCSLGKRVSPGANGSKGALASSLETVGIGSDELAEFTPAANSRLRLWVKTNAPNLRLSFTSGSGAAARTWSVNRAIAGSGWQSLEIALSEFKLPEKDEGSWHDTPCGKLQFRMRFEDNDPTLPSERYLVIDDIEIFTPR